VIPQTRQDILDALIKHGNWHFIRDSPYNMDRPERTPDYIKWIEWAKQRR
jgi:hypothetical protein